MITTAVIDRNGRLLIPNDYISSMHLRTGSLLEISIEGKDVIRLRSIRSKGTSKNVRVVDTEKKVIIPAAIIFVLGISTETPMMLEMEENERNLLLRKAN